MSKDIEKKLIEKILATQEQFEEAQRRMKDFSLVDPEAYERAFHDALEADAANDAYTDAFRMVTGRYYVAPETDS